MAITKPLCIGSVFDTLFSHGVGYTLVEYPELEPCRLLLVKILWTERRLTASEAFTQAMSDELVALERSLQARVNDEIMTGGVKCPSVLGTTVASHPWISWRWSWPFSRGSMTIRQTFRSIIAACSWRWGVAVSAATVIWSKN